MITSNKVAPVAERDRVLREIARLEAFVEDHPDSSLGAQRMLAGEREHLARIESTLAAAGWAGHN